MDELNKSLSHFMDLSVSLEEELKKVKKINEQLVKENNDLKSENNEMKPYKTKISEISNLEKSIESLTKENNTLKSENNEINSYKTKLKEIMTDYSNLEKSNELLSKEIEDKAKTIKNYQDLNDQITFHKTELEAKNKYIEDMQKKLDNFEKIGAGEQFEKLSFQRTVLKKENEKLNNQLNEKINEIENQKQQYILLENKNNTLITKLNEYKKNSEDEIKNLNSKINKLEEETSNLKLELNKTKSNLDEVTNKYEESNKTITNLREEIIEVKNNAEKITTDAYKEIEKLNEKMKKESENVVSNNNVKNLICDNIYLQYINDISISFNKIVDYILINFPYIIQNLFLKINKEDKSLIQVNLYQTILKEIYFSLYIRGYIFKQINIKENKLNNNNKQNEKNYSLNSEDFNDDIINNLSKNLCIINKINNDHLNKIENYIKKINLKGLNEEILKNLNDSLNKKHENGQIFFINSIKSLLKKCAQTIKEGKIIFENKILFDFNPYILDCINFSNNNLTINFSNINNINYETIINIIKYPLDTVYKVNFIGNLNIKENFIKEIFLYLISYLPNILSFSFKNCKSLKKEIFEYIITLISSLPKLKILNFENCEINNEYIKILSEKLKENQTINVLILNNNKITNDGGIYLSELLTNNKNIKDIFLSHNNICGKGLQSILNTLILQDNNLNTFDISYNNFKSEDFKYLAEFFLKNPKIINLNLNGNFMDQKSCENLGNSLQNLNNIKLISMNSMGIANLDNFPNLFKNFKFENIYLDNNPFGEFGIIILFKAFDKNSKLKRISLKQTQIHFLGIKQMLDCLINLNEIEEVNIEKNEIDEQSCLLIKDFLNKKKIKIYITKSLIIPQDKINKIFDNEFENVILVE